ncbi:tripartite tricarboxylate transporter substrate binding protein [Alcaligenaceae bacterium]|nr:tripartite tricarboxylate transporter substrate binding protein [Alcaligenaceae bacterium]
MKSWLSLPLIAVALLGAPLANAAGDTWPDRPIHIISPYSPGGGNDSISRLVAQHLGQVLGQQVIVENRAGAGTMIGNDYVAKSAPDGYTLIVNGAGFVTNPSFYANMRYDSTRDFTPVAFLASSPLALVGNASVPFSTMPELIDYAKKHPGKLSFGNSGYGGPDHYACIMFNEFAGVDIASVPYKGSAQVISDLLGGHLHLTITPLPAVQEHIQMGKLKMLAIAAAQRSPQFPDVPTIAESGMPEYEALNWYGLMAPAGTPPAVVHKINEAVGTILLKPEVIKVFNAQGMVPRDPDTMGSPEQFAAYLQKGLEQTERVAKAAGIEPQ